MDFRDAPAEVAFRDEVRSFLDANFPPDFATDANVEWGLFNGARRQIPGHADFIKEWTAKLNVHGWGAPHWPKEYGGGSLSVKQHFILNEEFAEAGGTESFLMLWDESFQVWDLFGVTGTPAAVLLSGDGEVIEAWSGRFPLDDVVTAAQGA